MKTIFAILLIGVTSFAFAEEPTDHCEHPTLGSRGELNCKKDHGEDEKLCGPMKWDDINGGYDDDFGRHCNPIYCIAIYDEKQKKDVHRWACDKGQGKPKCKGKAVRSCHGLKGDECTASFMKGNPGTQCGLHSDGSCSNRGGACNG